MCFSRIVSKVPPSNPNGLSGMSTAWRRSDSGSDAGCEASIAQPCKPESFFNSALTS